MKKTISMRRLIWLICAAALIVGSGIVVYDQLHEPVAMTIEDVLWVKKNGTFYPPGSPVSRDVIDQLHPNYINFDEMTFSGPLVLLLPSLLGDADEFHSKTPLVIMPYDP